MPTATRSRRAAPRAEARRYGSETPRVFTPPLRKLTSKTSLGFEVIEFAEHVLGISLLPWQRWLLIHALELLPDGTFRFRTVVVLVARQNGKSTLLQILALWRMYVDGAKLVIGTAQNLDIAEEVWQGAVDMAQEVDELADEIERVVQVNGKKSLELTFGSRYKVQAANRRGGRSLSGDLVALDELREHQSWDAWGALTKTTMARPRAQVWALSNAGDHASVVLRFLRRLAHKNIGDPDGLWANEDSLAEDEITEEIEDAVAGLEEDDSLGIFEWSAPPGCSIHDRDGWAMANPSMGYTITERTIASAVRTDPEPVLRVEVLCQWVDDLRESVITDQVWKEARAPELQTDPPGAPRQMVDRIMPAVDVAPGHSSAAIAMCGRRADGLRQIEIVDHRAGMSWAIERMESLCSKWGLPKKVALMSSGPAGALVPDLIAAGFEIEYIRGSAETGACGAFKVGVEEGLIVHLDQPPTNAAIAGAARRKAGDDGWKWARKDSSCDISPLVAATAAHAAMAALGDEPDAGFQMF